MAKSVKYEFRTNHHVSEDRQVCRRPVIIHITVTK
jgi:hypothetical protein